MTASMSGRSTLTTTSSPVGRVALCTWATDAAARGSGSKLASRVSIFPPHWASMAAMASAVGKGGTLSCNSASSSAMSAGSKSRRVDSNWPNLMNTGPRASRASRNRCPRGNWESSASLPEGSSSRRPSRVRRSGGASSYSRCLRTMPQTFSARVSIIAVSPGGGPGAAIGIPDGPPAVPGPLPVQKSAQVLRRGGIADPPQG